MVVAGRDVLPFVTAGSAAVAPFYPLFLATPLLFPRVVLLSVSVCVDVVTHFATKVVVHVTNIPIHFPKHPDSFHQHPDIRNQHPYIRHQHDSERLEGRRNRPQKRL
jgi:hypothetical protein